MSEQRAEIDGTAAVLAGVLRRLVIESESGSGAGLSNGDWFHIDSGVPVSGDEYNALQRLFEDVD